jgi:adenosylcobinamide-phosphate synthase
MPPLAAAAIALSFGLDLAVAEPPRSVHPVAWFGRVVALFDRQWSSPWFVGTAIALFLPLAAAGLVWGVTDLAIRIAPVVGATVAGLALFSTTSRVMLLRIAREVVDATETDPERARMELRALAGRNAAPLSPAEIRSAATESAAENLADGLVGPLLVFSLLASVSLPAAAAGATWVKAVNTLDSMLGYRSKPTGGASARLDDAVMWIPARLSSMLVALVARDSGALVRARQWARTPPSPNSGWPMATLAAVLGVRLEKPGVYILHPTEQLPTATEAHRGVAVVDWASLLSFLIAGVIAWF